MMSRGSATLKEILSQPEIWRITLEKFYPHVMSLKGFFDQNKFDAVVFTGCGSTYYLSLAAASLLQEVTHSPVQAKPASELLFFPHLSYLKGANILVVAVSRSGETSETISAIKKIKNSHLGKVLVITCNSASSLAHLADYLLYIDEAQEESVAQTRSFSSMMLLAQAFAGVVGDKDLSLLNTLPDRCHSLLSTYAPFAKDVGQDLSTNQFFFLGNGYLYGIACEAMLKMKEMTISHSEAYHFLEFRHGPMSMVDEKSIVIGLISEQAMRQELEVLSDMRKLGAKTIGLGFNLDGKIDFLHAKINLGETLSDWIEPILYLPILQLMGYFRSMEKGFNPDRPNNLEAVVKLSTL